MNNKILIGILVISLGLNVGTFTMLFYEKFIERRESKYSIEESIFETLALTDEQEKKIEQMREKWFMTNDSLTEKLTMLKASLETIPETGIFVDSLHRMVITLEDSHKTLFEKYLKEYQEILDDSQMKIFKLKVTPRIKVIKIDMDGDTIEQNVGVKVIKRIEQETEKEEKK